MVWCRCSSMTIMMTGYSSVLLFELHTRVLLLILLLSLLRSILHDATLLKQLTNLLCTEVIDGDAFSVRLIVPHKHQFGVRTADVPNFHVGVQWSVVVDERLHARKAVQSSPPACFETGFPVHFGGCFGLARKHRQHGK